MTREVEQFLDLATRPLEASPHERDEAKGELMSRIAHGGVPYEMLDLTVPLERLEKRQPGSLQRGALLSGMLLLLAAATVAITSIARDVYLVGDVIFMSIHFTGPGSGRSYDQDSPVLKHARSVAPGLPLGLHPEAGGVEETSDHLARNPDDLAMFQEHLSRRLLIAHNTADGFTPDDQQTIDRLDGDNALWPLMQLGSHLAAALTWPDCFVGSPGATGPIVTDESEFKKSLEYFSEAASKPDYLDRSTSLKRRQLDAFPPARSLTQEIVAHGFTEMISRPSFGMFDASLSSLASVQCERLAVAKDKEGLMKFFSEWKQLTRNVARSTGPYDAQLAAMGTSFVDAFGKLAMAGEKAEAEKWTDALGRANRFPATVPAELKDSLGTRLRSERLPSGLIKDEALPSRKAELAFFDRIVTGFLTTVALVFAGLVGFETCRRSRIVKSMARGLMPLFRKEDHLWIAGLGIALPWLWWFAISRLSPLGLRDMSMSDGLPVIAWLTQSIAGVIFGMIMLLQTARWRWNVRGRFVGLGFSLPWIGWSVAALTGLSIPVVGVLRYLGSMSDDETVTFMLAASGMAACGLLWLSWQGVMALFTPRFGSLRPNVTMRAVLPWAMIGTATLLASVAVATVMERYWYAKDPLLPPWTSKTYLNALDERVAGEIQEALRGL